MEINIINSLIKKFPDSEKGLQELKNKLVDVYDIFMNMDYYHPAFKSNFSLKAVSSVLLDEINYSKISSGLEAMNFYAQQRLSENEIEKQNIQNELIEYCNMDSKATFKLVEVLKNISDKADV